MIRRRHAAGLLGLGAAGSPFGTSRGASFEPAPAPLTLAFFGAHFHRLLAVDAATAPTIWPDSSVGSLRLWDSGTRWGDIAPSRGVWRFERLDAYVERASAQGAQILYTLGSTPRWASARPDEPGPYGPGCAAEPQRMADWIEYVERVADRYRGRIHAYELWNEPQFSDLAHDRAHPGGFYSGSVSSMVEMARTARAALSRLAPSPPLLSPGFVNGPHRLELFLRSGAAPFVQGIAYHFYARDTRQFVTQVADVRIVMAREGVPGLPLLNTECGVESEGGSDTASRDRADVQAASTMAQFVILGAALRLERFYYHAWDNDRTGMVDRNGRRSMRLIAWNRLHDWLLGARVSAPQESQGRALVGASRGSHRYLFAWSLSHQDVPMRLGTPVIERQTLLGPITAAQAPHAPVTLDQTPQRLRLGAA